MPALLSFQVTPLSPQLVQELTQTIDNIKQQQQKILSEALNLAKLYLFLPLKGKGEGSLAEIGLGLAALNCFETPEKPSHWKSSLL